MRNAIANTRLEKAAQDNGFDLEAIRSDDWLIVKSSRCPITIWLQPSENGDFVLALSDSIIGSSIRQLGQSSTISLPSGASSIAVAPDLKALYSMLKRTFQLSRSLPSEPLREFQKQIVGLPRTTEVERLVVQRLGQDIFRERLLEYWDGKCAVTGLSIQALLKASHIMPWKDCASDVERLDVYNGLLLAPHFDAAFDRGFISFGDDGALIASSQLGSDGLKILGIERSAKVSGLTSSHLKYLAWHRAKEFKGT